MLKKIPPLYGSWVINKDIIMVIGDDFDDKETDRPEVPFPISLKIFENCINDNQYYFLSKPGKLTN